MPVIAFNASAKIAEWYGDIQKGKRSKVINNRLERALRLDSQPIEIMSAQSLEDSLKSHREQIEKLQLLITKFSMESEEKENIIQMYKSKSFFQRIFRF
jgi:uncharacterized protein (DUF342 family)|tara:strand:- start:111 stop:407 length:297 start_codon:yes stop_codon:yes gene_type:complete